MSLARSTVSLPQEMYDAAAQRQSDLGYATFSAYVQALIRADVLTQTSHVRTAAPLVSLHEKEQTLTAIKKAAGKTTPKHTAEHKPDK